MEHILQFAISIDEDRIQEEIKRSAVNKASKELTDAVKKELGQDYYGRFSDECKLYKMAEAAIKNVVKEHENHIVESIAKNVAEGLVRSPKFREKVLNKLEDKNND